MCFFIHEKHPTEKIAEEDIICYKIVRDDLQSLYCRFQYCYNGLYTDPESLKPFEHYDTIFRGYHSYSNEEAVNINFKDNVLVKIIPSIIVKCIIPKGAHYYYNPRRCEYISNQIKIIKKVE